MIRYAGYDPNERDLGEYEVVPPVEFASVPIERGPRRISVERAMELRESGRSWREVAQLLSWETGRNFTHDGVSGAVGRQRRATGGN
jgi:3-methyladenine DNA glycosylase/8-oxoguanine DNA glycosylase